MTKKLSFLNCFHLGLKIYSFKQIGRYIHPILFREKYHSLLFLFYQEMNLAKIKIFIHISYLDFGTFIIFLFISFFEMTVITTSKLEPLVRNLFNIRCTD